MTKQPNISPQAIEHNRQQAKKRSLINRTILKIIEKENPDIYNEAKKNAELTVGK